MTVGNLHAGQAYEQNQVHYLYLDFDNETGLRNNAEGSSSLGWLPEGAVISAAYVVTSVALIPTAARITFGWRNRGDSVADDTDGITSAITTALGRVSGTLATTGNLRFPEGGEVTVTRSAGNALTAGQARAVVEYTVPNQRP